MKTWWYLTRGSGAVSLILLTVAVVVGVAAVGRVRTRAWPRFATDGLHRSSSLLALVFLVVHILTATFDSFAPIALSDAIIPFAGAYRPLWLGLGAVAFDLLLAIVITSLVRQRIGLRRWRAIHWLAYAAWPLALLHGLGTGSDVRQEWMTLVYVVCAGAVLAAGLVRVVIGWPAMMRWRLTGLGAIAAYALGLLIWLPGGPLAAHWARRAGTPARLLGLSATAGRRR